MGTLGVVCIGLGCALLGALAVIVRQRRRPKEPKALEPRLQALDELPPCSSAEPPKAVLVPHVTSVVPAQQVAQLPVATTVDTVIQQKATIIHAVL